MRYYYVIGEACCGSKANASFAVEKRHESDPCDLPIKTIAKWMKEQLHWKGDVLITFFTEISEDQYKEFEKKETL